VRRLLTSWCVAVLALASAPVARAELIPWFASQVGPATQVISVVGTGGTDAKVDVYERTTAGWRAAAAGIPAKIGSKGMSPNHFDGSMMTPMGIYTLDFAFGTQPNPGGGLQYVQVTPDHWWDGDMKSPTYNTMQVCEKASCPFSTSLSDGTENLDIPQYAHAVVMGVNKQRIPGKGGAFFLHTTDGGPTAGCVAVADDTMVELIRWLKPGALIALSK
jgi:L,D-peptidoglycan transpeptidase YkuD (ErfK/YbiS/YcfS/YnhG family)